MSKHMGNGKSSKLYWVFPPSRKNRRSAFIQTVLILLTLILLFWTYHVYQSQAILMREIIFHVVGEDRNTNEKVLPLVDTTILQPSHGCQFSGRNTLGIIVVPTLPEHRARREVIRTTWGSNRFEAQMMLFFFTGMPTDGDLTELHQEAATHGDLIIENLEENYYALAVKTLRILKWFNRNCPRSKFLIKADDDVFLNLPLFAKRLEALPENFQFGGRVLTGRTPNLRNPFSKWYTPVEMWPEGTVAPSYIGGPCYVIKGQIVPKLLQAANEVPLYHLEDVFLSGMVASQKLGIELQEFPGTLDPKNSGWSYWYQKYLSFNDPSDFITSFHTDGDSSLIKLMYEDFETVQALKSP